MGCSYSSVYLRGSHQSSNPKLFKVVNINDVGDEISRGSIEITDTDLILHQKNKDGTVWPLRSLRRYGMDEDLFSFESGRRCSTGVGIFAFKCKRAEALFNLLQNSIQLAGQEEQCTSSTLPSQLNNVGNDEHEYVNSEIPMYVNGPWLAGSNGVSVTVRSTSNESISSPLQYLEIQVTDPPVHIPEPLYHNVQPVGLQERREGSHKDMQISLVRESGESLTPGVPPSPTSIGSSVYADSLIPKSASNGYAQIDFKKTAALSNTLSNRNGSKDEGSRKTRHNSNIEEFKY